MLARFGPPYEEQFLLNHIRTAKYNVWNFIPKNLFVQLVMKLPNLYFVFLTILEIIPIIGSGVPSLLLPLSFVVSVSMLKDAFEDYQRYKSDDEENHRKVAAIPLAGNNNTESVQTTMSKDEGEPGAS